MLPEKLAFVDIETTGGRSVYDRIIEIGILRIENNQIVKTFSSLINPLTHLPPEIVRLTGITGDQLMHAPTFNQVKDEITEILKDCIFVAHNVRFDYGFLKSEYKRLNDDYTAKHFCTVKLSRLLFPQYPRHNLDSIIERYGFSCENRHRAFDDAKILYDFYTHLQNTLSPEELKSALDRAMKKPSLPLNLKVEDLEVLPESPGVYIFYGEEKSPLYIGKSINIKERVLSHFSSDIRSGTEMKISQQISSIETICTPGELGALFLESSLIKSRLPLYNKRLRLKKQLVVLKNKQDSDGFERIRIDVVNDITSEDIKTLQDDPTHEGIVGFFRSQKQAKDYLLTIAQEFGLCEKLLGIEKTAKACFGYRLGRCKGACQNEEMPLFYNLRFTTAISKLRIKPWPFRGPIVIEEKHPFDGNKELFIIDKWCYLGSMKASSEGDTTMAEKSVLFDLDVYKILKNYLLKPANQKRIRLLKPSELLFSRNSNSLATTQL